MAEVTATTAESTDPQELYGQGLRAYILQDFELAVSVLSKTTELLVAKHEDDLHSSLGKVYLYYGKSLLGLSRDQNEALGDAVPKDSTEDSDDDEEEDEAEAEAEPEVVEKSSEPEKIKEIAAEPVVSSNNLDDEAAKNEVDSSTKAENGEVCEEATDLQLAWEVLELAKKIFAKEDDQKSLAECLIVLGEVSLESENFTDAINDIKQGLEIQKGIFSKDNRTVAETYYKLGVAYGTNNQIDEAIASFNSSLDYLNGKIKSIEESKIMSDEQKAELQEIKELIPDIEDRITDMKIFKDEALKKITAAAQELSKPAPEAEAASSSKPATDINHLIKRKRKLEEEESNGDIPSKKPTT